MKKPILPLLLALSLALNLFLGGALLRRPAPEADSAFFTEVGFAVSALEGTQERHPSDRYTLALSHLYAIQREVLHLDRELEIAGHWDDFYQLWNRAQCYPELFPQWAPKIAHVLGKFEADTALNDADALAQLSALVEELTSDAGAYQQAQAPTP